MSRDAARPDLDRGLLTELKLAGGKLPPLPVPELGLIYRRGSVLSATAQALVKQVQAECARRPAAGKRQSN